MPPGEPPTTSELARDVGQLEERIDREYRQLRESMDRGFARVGQQIEQLQVVHPGEFAADQQRQDQAVKALWREVGSLRRIVVGGLLTVIAASAVVALLAG